MKKILSIILILVNLLTISALADTIELNDIQKTDLYNLGIMVGDQNGNLRLEDNITSAEAVKMICAAGKISVGDVDEGEAVFPDVSREHWAYEYICAAKKCGIVKGDEKGYFNPESTVTNEEIIKMIVCLLGYGEMAMGRGGYPAGYKWVASNLKITENMQLTTDAPAIRNDVGIMFYNAVDIPMMISNVDEDGNGVYAIADGSDGNPPVTLRNKK